MKLSEPTLLLDEDKCRNNIAFMADKARQQGVALHPHFKTHQSQAIGEWFAEEGVKAITVSSLRMAAYFADDGWEEITVAFPVNVLRMKIIKDLSKRIRLNLFVNNLESAQYLESKLKRPIGVFTEIDTGYHRSGVDYQSRIEIAKLLEFFKSSSHLQFQGFYAHAGHTYQVQGKEAVSKIHRDVADKLNAVREHFSPDYGAMKVAVGDTPSCSLADDFSGVDIIRPGNFVFYDLVQAHIGACTTEDIAVCMACPVVEIHPERGEVLVHGGAVHFSKDALQDGDQQIYGKMVHLHNKGWGEPLQGCYMKSLSQEHGIVKLSPEVIDSLKVGDWIGILPVHSCLTANLMGSYCTLSGHLLESM
ncbi:alanine racemase [Catalinimonas niigatensis]|uniref:alanine racemase n=1 Tax=Catalinimonas niigatensis TaxID=1397264 RepID=UPI002665B202|nr:alanine racemase [Catalinimonas niigatensis]WPP52648.1 alanine racemase [Catalinimonas niigatensis]